MLPIEFQIHTFKMAVDLGIDLNEAQQERIQQLNQLMKCGNKQRRQHSSCKNKGSSGMMHISRRNSSRKEIRLYSLILNSEIIKPSLLHIGWAQMK